MHECTIAKHRTEQWGGKIRNQALNHGGEVSKTWTQLPNSTETMSTVEQLLDSTDTVVINPMWSAIVGGGLAKELAFVVVVVGLP